MICEKEIDIVFFLHFYSSKSNENMFYLLQMYCNILYSDSGWMGDGFLFFPDLNPFLQKASCLKPFKFACPPCVFERCSYHRGLG